MVARMVSFEDNAGLFQKKGRDLELVRASLTFRKVSNEKTSSDKHAFPRSVSVEANRD